MEKRICDQSLEDHNKVIKSLEAQKEQIIAIAQECVDTIKNGGKIMFAGNGGSAAEAQHFAAEFCGRYKKEREGLPGICLNTDTSALTAIGNDYGYEKVFSRQIEAIADSGDIIFLLTTSGNSPNLIEAAKKANSMGVVVMGLLGKGGGPLLPLCNSSIVIKSTDTARIQEAHLLILHIICELVDEQLTKRR
ncbi:SIS domain-containing protein [Candidatus Micrarchaeota archaeon]|nr:SIS domain-containing protein [Candidatus Micrarchaeota archaeon]